jgi:hypothetical protein
VSATSNLFSRGKSTPAILATTHSFPMVLDGYPCRCLWRGFSQMIRNTRLRRMILHFSQIGFTEARTFMTTPLPKLI